MTRLFLASTFLSAGLMLMPGCSSSDEGNGSDDAQSSGAGNAADDQSSNAGNEDDSTGDDSENGSAESDSSTESDIVDTAVAADFKTLVAAVKAAELVDTLKGEGPFTVFAPTDEAFAALPEGTLDELLQPENKEKLTSILTYHVVAGKVMASDVVKLESAKTVQGGEVSIEVDSDTVKVDGATVSKADIACSNGLIHVIDRVILPKE